MTTQAAGDACREAFERESTEKRLWQKFSGPTPQWSKDHNWNGAHEWRAAWKARDAEVEALKSEVAALRGRVETAREALESAQQAICSEYCGATVHHGRCSITKEALERLGP